MKNYFLSHLPKGKWNKKNYFPSQISTFPLRPAKPAKFIWEGLRTCPHMKIFNAKSCILSISERVLKINWFSYFVFLFIINLRYESEYNYIFAGLWLLFLIDRFSLGLLVVKSGNFTQRVHNIFSFS